MNRAKIFESLQRVLVPRVLVGLFVVVGVIGVGTQMLSSSRAQAPQLKPVPPVSTKQLLRPYSLGMAPYQYIAYSGSVEQTRAASGVKDIFAAFIISDAAADCTPAWGGTASTGLASPRSQAIAADFTNLRSAGGEVIVSFGGSNGAELATTCKSPQDLAAAYKSVIDTYGLKRLDFDVEGPGLADEAANRRRAEAVASLQNSMPELKVWVTLPVHTNGITTDGIAVIRDMIEAGVVLSGINIMAMNYNVGIKDMGNQAIKSAEASFGQLRQLFPSVSESNLWKSMGITVMVGVNDTLVEIFTLEDAAQLRTFAAKNGVGMLSIWSATRDTACPVNIQQGAANAPSVSCSGVGQEPYQFIRALTVPTVQ